MENIHLPEGFHSIVEEMWELSVAPELSDGVWKKRAAGPERWFNVTDASVSDLS